MNLARFDLPALSTNWRLGLWILVIALSTVLLTFPTHMSTIIQIFQAPYVFDNLFLFSTLFIIWMALLLMLLFAKGPDIEKLAIVSVFTLVFNGFWKIAFAGPRGITETYAFAMDMRLIGQYGRLPPQDIAMVYSNFPGFDLLGYSIHTVTGIDYMPQLEKVISLLFFIFSAAMLYLIARSVLKDNRASAMSAILFVAANAQIARTYAFQARYFGWCLLLLTIAWLFSAHRGKALFSRWEGNLVIVLVLVALTITHAPSTLFMVIVLVSVYLVHWLTARRPFVPLGSRRPERTAQFSFTVVLLSTILFMTWETFYAEGIFESTVIVLPKTLDEIWRNIVTTINTFFAQSQAHIGPGIPGWVKVVELVWIGITIGLGSLIGLWDLFHIRKLSLIEKTMLGGFIAAIVSTIVSIIIGRSSEEYFRIFLFLPIFTVPLLTLFLTKRRPMVVALLTLLFLFSIVPTFLVDNKETPNNITFQQEIATAKFIESNYDSKRLSPFSSTYTLPDMHKYYAPDANIVAPYVFVNGKQAETLMARVLSSGLSGKELNDLKQNLNAGTPLINLNEEYILISLRFSSLKDEELLELTQNPGYNDLLVQLAAHPKEELVSSLLMGALTGYQVVVLVRDIVEIRITELISGMDKDHVEQMKINIELEKLMTDPTTKELISGLNSSDEKQPENFIYAKTQALFGTTYTESRRITSALWAKLTRILDQQELIYNDGLIQIYRF